MQKWRGCLPIIGYFAELQERQAVTQASEPEVVSEHSEGDECAGRIAWPRQLGGQARPAGPSSARLGG
jgi:hypothetical protein